MNRKFHPLSILSGGAGKPYANGKDAPDPPDYAGAAQATAAGNADAARVAARANRVDQYSPWGNLIYTDLGNDRWRSDTVLSPAQQKMLDQNNTLGINLLDTANKGLDYAAGQISKPGVDVSKLPQFAVNPGQTAQDAIMSRLEPNFNRAEDLMRTRLANQGIMGGSEAYNREVEQFNQGRNDAYTQAALQGMGIGNQTRQQAFEETAYNQMQPINVINALRTGNQVNSPQFNPVPQQATTAGPDMLGAAAGNFQADLARSNARNAGIGNTLGGLFQMGSAYFGNPNFGR